MPAQLKDATARARANKSPSRATLRAVDPNDPDLYIPELRPRSLFLSGMRDGEYWERTVEVDWRPETLLWWVSVWTSPMRSEFTGPDEEGLQMLALLIDAFWRTPNAANHSEIRLSEQKFGLTPLDRRRLEWTIEQSDEAKAKGDNRRAAQPKAPAATPSAAADPRQHTA